jgi:predicted GTPase
MGYGREQIHDLEETINRVDCDVVLIATPIDLGRLINIRHQSCRVTYEFKEASGKLHAALRDVLAKRLLS